MRSQKFMPFIALILIFLSAAAARAQTAEVEKFLRREMQERRIPGLQAAVVKDGKIVLLEAFGIANVQNAVPVSNESVFAINSCTKAFTGVAVMQLVEEGKLDLAAPVSRYLDNLPPAWQSVTIRQLLTHVSGLPDVLRILNAAPPGGAPSEDEIWKATMARPMEFPTGEKFSYNQTNYALLGKIIDKLRGKPFAADFGERQFRVAGMPNTGFGDSRDVVPNMAPSYKYVTNFDGQTFGDGKLVNNYAEFPLFRRTASGMNSTAGDIAKWIIALQDGRLLKTGAALQTLWTAGAYNNGAPTQWALGWVTKPRPTHRAVMMSGGGRAAFIVYPEDRLAVVVLTNLLGASPEDFIDELAGFYAPEVAAADPVTRLRIELRKRGFEKTSEVFAEIKRKDPAFRPLETDLNDWAYRMLSKGQKKPALEIFKLNVELYPASANVYDSLAEAYESLGEKELAVKNYRRSLELDPQNKNAADHLNKLAPGDK